MQKIDRKFIYKRVPRLVPWWMIAGTTLAGRVLLIGVFSKNEIFVLSGISKSVEFIDYQDFISGKSNKLNEMPKEFDLIIINTLNNSTPLDLRLQYKRWKILWDYTPAIVLLESNPYHVKNFFRRPVSILKSIFYDVRSQHIEQYLNGRDLTKYETNSENVEPYESFPASTYYTNKNSFLKLERVKFTLLNSRYSRIFYNSQIWTLTFEKKLLVQSILADVWENSNFKWEGKEIKILKIFFNNGKIILSLTSKTKNQPEYILILPFDECALQQRFNEKEAIKKLRSMNECSKYFVEEIITGAVGHLTYFAMKEFSGITVDIENPNLGLMTDNAVNVIKKFTKIVPHTDQHNQTRSFLGMSSEYINLMLERMPQHSSIIVNLGKSLPQTIDLPVIMFMHGDMKLENFVIDPRTNQVVGIIDLELAELPGLPLIDLYYLIAYNYQTINQETFYQSFVRLMGNDLTTVESTYIQDYCRFLNISENQKKLCLAFFYLHHYAKRISFTINHESGNKDFLAGCERIIDMLEDLPPIV